MGTVLRAALGTALRAACCGLREGAPRGVALAVLGFAACATGEGAEVIIRDSAGVRIVENPATNAEIPRWALDSAPRVSIGVLDGDSTYQLDRVEGVVLHGDRIVVANGGSRELRVFDLEGRHVASGGRQGGGPGEFETINWLGRFDGDSLVVYDNDNRRFSIFDLNAGFARSINPVEDFAFIAGRFADGSYLLPPTVSFSTSQGLSTGMVRDSTRIIRVSSEGAEPDTLVRLMAGELYLMVSEQRIGARRPPFSHTTRVAVGDSLFHTGTSDAYEISTWSRNGSLVRVLRRTIAPAPVTQAEIDRYKQLELEDAETDDQRRARERTLAELPYPDRMPAHGPLRVDDDGNLWVQDYSPWTAEPTEWTVFDADGRAIGRVRIPARFEIHQIGSDFVLGVTRDDLDVERVVVYGLARSPSRETAGRGGDT